MPVVALPNPVQGVCARLLSRSEITDEVGQRISKVFQPSWDAVADKRAILVGRAGGPVPASEYGYQYTRLEVRCYGRNTAEAIELWGIVNPVLSPGWRTQDPAQGIRNAWVAGGLRCAGIDQETGPQDATDPDHGDRPFILCFYLIMWAETPAP